jgi:hypothetical protein
MKKHILAGIEHATLSPDELHAAAADKASPSLMRLQGEYGVFRYQPAAGILNKREAASAYVMIAHACREIVREKYPSTASRVFTMACMIHYKSDGIHFTNDFLAGCDDIYLNHAAKGFHENHPKHGEWVRKALSDMDEEQIEFACRLFADIHQVDAAAVMKAVAAGARAGMREKVVSSPPSVDKDVSSGKAKVRSESPPITTSPALPCVTSVAGNEDLLRQMMSLAREIVRCPHFDACRRECPSMDREPPQPGFVGRRYRGLVILGANPGCGQGNEFYLRQDKECYRLAQVFADSGSIEDYGRYLDFTGQYMGSWHAHLCNREFRSLLGYDIEEVAYLNLVKCRTLVTGSDVFANCGEAATNRCVHSYLLRQLSALQPKYIACHWQGVARALPRIGIGLNGIEVATLNGARHLSAAAKIAEIKPLFARFAGA